jgi:hypothetical protein
MNRRRLLQYLFFTLFILTYLFQQVGRREDWPFTFFGMYRGARPDTSPYFRFEPKYTDDLTGETINPYGLKVDMFFLDEKIRSILLGTFEGVNNDMLKASSGFNGNAKLEVQNFLKTNVIPLLKEQCHQCKLGVLSLQVFFWEDLKYSNFLRPDKSYSYTQVRFER